MAHDVDQCEKDLAEARALLDLLQRAEAVVEALKEALWFMETADYGIECTIGPVGKQHNIYQKGKKALAAWEEGTA